MGLAEHHRESLSSPAGGVAKHKACFQLFMLHSLARALPGLAGLGGGGEESVCSAYEFGNLELGTKANLEVELPGDAWFRERLLVILKPGCNFVMPLLPPPPAPLLPY